MNANISIKKYVGERIREYRTGKNLTQSYMGEKLGVKNNTISAYERGEVSPDSEMLFNISNLLEISVNDLFPNEELSDLNELSLEDVLFIEGLLKKISVLKSHDRKQLIDNLKFALAFFEHNSD